MKYNILLVLRSGELKHLDDIVSISWTKARMIFVEDDDSNYIFYRGDIVKMTMEVNENEKGLKENEKG